MGSLDTLIMTKMLGDYQKYFVKALDNILPDTKYLLGALIIFDLVLAILLNLGEVDHIKQLVTKILKYGLFIYLVTNYSELANIIIKGCGQLGIKAAGGGVDAFFLTDPSKIGSYGIHLAQPLLNYTIISAGEMGKANNLLSIFSGIGMMTMGCYFIMAIQFFVTYLEFYIVGVFALFLIPFGANKWTSHIAQRAVGMVLSIGIRLAVISFIITISMKIIAKWFAIFSIAKLIFPNMQAYLYLLLISAAVTALVLHAPGVVASVFGGGMGMSSESLSRAAPMARGSFGMGNAGMFSSKAANQGGNTTSNPAMLLTSGVLTGGKTGMYALQHGVAQQSETMYAADAIRGRFRPNDGGNAQAC